MEEQRMSEKQLLKESTDVKKANMAYRESIKSDAQTLYGDNRVQYDYKTGTLRQPKKRR